MNKRFGSPLHWPKCLLLICASVASAAPATRLEKRLQNWFTAVERYPRQLHEMDREPYLEMKRAEYVRQQTVY